MRKDAIAPVKDAAVRRSRGVVASVILLVSCIRLGLAVQDPPPAMERPVSVEKVLASMGEADKARTALLKNYTSVRTYKLENRRFGTSAEVCARMSFTQPGGKTFEIIFERGSSVIRKRVLQRMIKEELEAAREEVRASSAITPANYAFRLLGMARADGRSCYLLEAAPKRRGKFLLRGRVWVDQDDYAIVRIEGSPAQNPSFLIRKTAFVHIYRKFGPFWLPVSNQSSTDVLFYGKTEVEVAYFDYIVNGSRDGTVEGRFKRTQAKTMEEPTGDGAETLFKP